MEARCEHRNELHDQSGGAADRFVSDESTAGLLVDASAVPMDSTFGHKFGLCFCGTNGCFCVTGTFFSVAFLCSPPSNIQHCFGNAENSSYVVISFDEFLW